MSSTTQRKLLLSIRPKFAEMILNGSKRVELRRIGPRITAGDHVYLYVSSPVRALAGKFVVDGVAAAPVDSLWEAVKEHAGISREHFDNYYSGVTHGHAIFVKTSSRLPSPIGLDVLRRIWRGFRPPQSYAYLSDDALRLLEDDVPCKQ